MKITTKAVVTYEISFAEKESELIARLIEYGYHRAKNHPESGLNRILSGDQKQLLLHMKNLLDQNIPRQEIRK